MRILILSLFILLCSSCYTGINETGKIKSIINTSNKELCKYYLARNDAYFYDRCDKFIVGDIIEITKVNQSTNQ